MRFPVVLFDLDGTLIDSGPIIVASMQHAARVVLGREVPEAELTAAIGGSGLVSQMRELDAEHVDELVEVYREHNVPLHDELEAFEGVVALLPGLRAEGRQLGVVTAKRHATVGLAFDRFPGLEEQFDIVVAHEDTDRHKPHPDPILHAVERLGADPAEAAYVGDSPFDVQAARAAGAYAIAVGWGGIHSAERLAEEQPDALVRTPEELRDAL